MPTPTTNRATSFRAIGIVDFHRKEVVYPKPKKSWWMQFIEFFLKEKDEELEVYHYRVTLHVFDYKIGVGTVIEAMGLIFVVVDWNYMQITLKTIQPVADWLTFTDFKKATYAIISRS